MGKIRTPFSHASWPKGTPIMVVIALIAFAIVSLLLVVVVAVWMVFVLFANINDINAVGANFWNVTWIVLASIVLLTILGSVFRGNK